MKNNENILQELREIAPYLANVEKKNLYTVPQDYFANFSSVVLAQAQLSGVSGELSEVAPALAGLSGLNKTEAPAGYFHSFSSGLLNKIRANEVADELTAIAPALSELEKVNAYEAPAGYFNTFAQQVLKQATVAQPQQQNAMPAWLAGINNALENVLSTVFKPRYSFAFAGTLSIAFLAVMMFTKVEQQCAETDIECQLAQLSTSELDEYITANADEFHKSVLDISTDETKLTNRNAKGTLSMEKYLKAELTDDELENAIY